MQYYPHLPPPTPRNLPLAPALLGPDILLNTLFLSAISFCFFLNVRDQVSHPHKTASTVTVLYVSILVLDSRREDKKFWTEWQEAFSECMP
jgi:hypothetical protein